MNASAIIEEFEALSNQINRFGSAKEVFIANREQECLICLTDTSQTVYNNCVSS